MSCGLFRGQNQRLSDVNSSSTRRATLESLLLSDVPQPNSSSVTTSNKTTAASRRLARYLSDIIDVGNANRVYSVCFNFSRTVQTV